MAAVTCSGLKSMETVSDFVVPEAVTEAVACFTSSVDSACVLPSNVIDFEPEGNNCPTLIPETISPKTVTPSI